MPECHVEGVSIARPRVLAWACALSLLTAGCAAEPNAAPAPSSPPPVPAGLALHVPRAAHHATSLLDGRVLITGGCTEPGCGGWDTAQVSEIFDPSTQQLSTGPRMQAPRASDAVTLLPDGRVLLTGGYPGEGLAAVASAEVFDPRSNSFTATTAMTTARANHTATLLPDGDVLLCGGVDSQGRALRSTELFDADDGTFTPGPSLSTPRAAHSAVVVAGRVVLVGGTVGGAALPTTDVLQGGTWQPGPTLQVARVKHAAAAITGDRVLVIGGATGTEGRMLLRSTELIDLGSGDVTAGPRLSEGQYKLDGAVTELTDGRIVIAGGKRINVYDPSDNSIEVLDGPSFPRRSFVTATAVGARSVLVAGGYDDAIVPTADARLVRVPR